MNKQNNFKFNFHNLSKPTKAIIIVSLAVTILASLEYSSIYVQADHDTLTFTITPGSNQATTANAESEREFDAGFLFNGGAS